MLRRWHSWWRAFGAPARAAGEPDWDGDGAISADCDKLDPAQHPGAVDIPDLTFEDLNCDAMDGDSDDALFVAPAGSDANVGTPNAPFQTVQHAIDVARTGAKKAIYIATGTYNQRLALGADADGIRLYGGYAAGTWARTRSSATTVNGSPEALALDGATDVLAQLVTLHASNGGGDKSAYGVRAVNGAELALEESQVTAGAGASGSPGGGGTTPAKAAIGAAGHTQVVPQGQGGTPCDYAGLGGSAGQPGNGFDGGAGGTGGEETNDSENGQSGSEGGGGAPGGDGGAGGTDASGDADNLAANEDGKTGTTGTTGAAGTHGGGGANDLAAAGATWTGPGRRRHLGRPRLRRRRRGRRRRRWLCVRLVLGRRRRPGRRRRRRRYPRHPRQLGRRLVRRVPEQLAGRGCRHLGAPGRQRRRRR